MNLEQISAELSEVFQKWGQQWTDVCENISISKTPTKEEILQNLQEMIAELNRTKKIVHRPNLGLVVWEVGRNRYWIGLAPWDYDKAYEESRKKDGL
ncbi:MAG: hypothetical protein JW840_10670 [Candidatus Thermoplasmatota archaeon]|nr:hypothetical protein [Candidatus Thermoplasmatota archaeon]